MLRRLKRLFDQNKYNEGSIRLMDMGGSKGEKQPPFDHKQAARAFNSWVYAAASINAFACAATPLRLYVKKGAGTKVFNTRPVPKHRKSYLLGDHRVNGSVNSIRKLMEFGDDFEEVSDQHPILDLMSNVNPVYNGFDLTATRILYGELTGNAYCAVIYDQNLQVPVQMWTMPSQWTFVVPDPQQFIKGYAYAAPGNQAVEFARDEVIHFRRPNPNDLFYGMGKVEAAYGTVGVNQAIHNMDLSTFANHARPDYAVVVKGPAGESSLKRFEDYVTERLQGTRKAGRFLTMTGDVTLTPLNFPPKDLSGREEVVEEIAAVFGVPVSMLKANDPNLASAQTGFAQWREGTILPLLRMDEDELNQTLIPMFGLEGDAMLCYDNPVPRDEQFELTRKTAAISGGWMTLNEARLDAGMEPYDDEMADKPLVNGQPLGGGVDDFGMGFNAYGDDEEEEEKAVDPQPAPTMTGPQITSMLKVLEGVGSGQLSGTAAVELIVATGLPRESATSMVEAQAATVTSSEQKQNEDDDLYATAEEAEAVAERIGCSGHHTHEVDGVTYYMPCSQMAEYTELTGQEHTSDDDPTLVDPKAIADVDLKPTSEMAAMAERGLELRKEHGRGGTEVGVARARNIKNRDNLSPETVGRMANFFGRHRVDLDAPAANPSHDDYPSAGVIAWLLWGGDPNDPDGAGAGWAQRKMDELDAAEEKASEHSLPVLEQSKSAKPECDCEDAKPECDCEKSKAVHVKQTDIWTPGTASCCHGHAHTKADSPAKHPNPAEWEKRAERFAAKLDKVFRGVLKRIRQDLDSMSSIDKSTANAVLKKHLGSKFTDLVASESRSYLQDSIIEGLKVGDGQMISAGFRPGEVETQAKKRLAKIVEQQTVRLARQVAGYTKVRLTDILQDGIEKGESIRDLSKRVGDWAGEAGDETRGTKARSRMIARTETTRAQIEGQIEAFEETGVVACKKWVLSPNACEFCTAVARKAKVAGLRDDFLSKGQTLKGTQGGTMTINYESINGAPLHPNCRCSVEPVLRSEMTR